VSDFSLAMFLAGIAIFIFGMSLLEDALKQLAGRPFKKFLQRQTTHKLRAVAAGTVVTALLQGSSVVLLMILSFVGAGIMTLRNALGVMLGANLGSTFNNWIVAWIGFKLNLEIFSYPLLALALVGFLFKSKTIKAITRFLIGFGLLFIGLEWMKTSVLGLVNNFDLSLFFSYSPYWFILIGFFVTSLVQSSSATMAIGLAALHNQVIPFESAACLVLGAELGTTLKLVLGALGGIPDKKRLAFGNFIFNLATLILATAFLRPLVDLVFNVFQVKDALIALVLFQSLVNLAGIVLFYPALGFFANFLESRFNGTDEDQLTRYIKQTTQPFLDVALSLARQETIRLFRHALDFNRHALGIVQKNMERKWYEELKELATSITTPEEAYKKLKMLQGEILEYLAELPGSEMNEAELEQSAKLLTVSRDIIHSAKNIKDITHNWHDMEASSNDILHELYLQTRKEESEIFDELQRLLVEADVMAIPDAFENMNEVNRQRHKQAIEQVMALLKGEEITELDASTLLNLFRELYSCHKALTSSLSVLHEISGRDKEG
jgi:phosphate:Na+ symporter